MKHLHPANTSSPPAIRDDEIEGALAMIDAIARAKFTFENLVPLWSVGALRALEDGGVDLRLTQEPFQQLRLYHRTFRALGVSAGEANMSELSDRLGLTVSTTTRLIDQMVRWELLERRQDARDRRVVLVGPSAVGERFSRVLDAAIRARLSERLRHLSADERAQLVRLVTKLFDLWTGAPGDPARPTPPQEAAR